jgi:hypothetical protein
MFEQLPAPDHVIAMRLSGKLTGEDVKKYRATLEDKLQKFAHMGICVDWTGLSDMNADALVEGTKADLELLGHLRQFSRCAFVSEKEWPQAIVQFMDPVFPTFEMKVFRPDQSEEAIAWAAESPTAPESKAPAFRFLETSKDDVLGFEIDGVISSEEMPGVIETFDTFLARHEKVRLLNRMKHFGGVDPAVFMQGGLVSMKLAAMQKVERYAIVGGPAWMRKVIETVNPAFADMDIRAFPADQEADAWAWLGTEPSK